MNDKKSIFVLCVDARTAKIIAGSILDNLIPDLYHSEDDVLKAWHAQPMPAMRKFLPWRVEVATTAVHALVGL